MASRARIAALGSSTQVRSTPDSRPVGLGTIPGLLALHMALSSTRTPCCPLYPAAGELGWVDAKFDPPRVDPNWSSQTKFDPLQSDLVRSAHLRFDPAQSAHLQFDPARSSAYKSTWFGPPVPVSTKGATPSDLLGQPPSPVRHSSRP
ncbi:unnamed protein product [Linum trigynum]|uniref:Uncharacterized protein n=1 Tax=Linum trigynum TaxID=586398 RepID=A0AAV2E307_9ROSI